MRTSSQGAKIKLDKLGRIWVTNGERTCHIRSYELDRYLQNGFQQGRKLYKTLTEKSQKTGKNPVL